MRDKTALAMCIVIVAMTLVTLATRAVDGAPEPPHDALHARMLIDHGLLGPDAALP